MALSAGPKKAASTDPLDLSGLGKRGHARVVGFAKTHLVVTKGVGQRKPFHVRRWQRDFIRDLFPAKGKRPRQGLISIPRGNGKSTIGAVLALYALFCDEVESPQILIVAADLRQAGIIFNTCRRMIELSPELSKRCRIYQDKIVVPGNDGVLMPLPADVGALQGWDPSLVLVDELHVVSHDVWESMSLTAGKRSESLCLALSTPADSDQSVMWDLVQLGRSDPGAFYLKEFTSDATHPVDCEHCWTVANPAMGDYLTVDGMRSALRTTREAQFRRLRLGQWLEAVDDAWVTPSLWDSREQVGNIPDGSDVVLALDGSFSGDATVLVAVTIAEPAHAEIVGLWEPHSQHDGYRVPVADVEQCIRDTCRRLQVREVVCDPYRWTRTMQALAAERLPVVEFPQSAQRMTPATIQAYEALVNGNLTHSGDPALRRHVLNARVREDARGTRLAKDSDKSDRKIDAAVALVMAHSRAVYFANKPVRRSRVVSFR